MSWVRGVPVVSAAREIDVSNAVQFRQALFACLDRQHAEVVVDMGETTFCDMSGLHQLIQARQRAAAIGGQVRLVVRAAMVLRIFEITGCDGLFRIFVSLDDALTGQPGTSSAYESRTDSDRAGQARTDIAAAGVLGRR